jgi:hypothetical protein
MAGQELTLGVETHCDVLRSGLLWPNSQILDYPAKPVADKPSNFFYKSISDEEQSFTTLIPAEIVKNGEL